MKAAVREGPAGYPDVGGPRQGRRELRVATSGPRPFATLHCYRLHGRRLVWRAREHRKGLARAARGLGAAEIPFWQTAAYNWATGALFAVGAFLFLTGSTLTLAQSDPGGPSSRFIAIVFFLGSIPFTLAAYLQHFQAANATAFVPDPGTTTGRPAPLSLIGWHPQSPGWLSTISQFVGTVAFNFNTFDAIDAPAGWLLQDLVIWLPGLTGSILFLVSGYLAFIEAGHAYWSWRPQQLAWWIVLVNLLGCVAFMVAGVLAYVPSGAEPGWIPLLATAHLWLGALCFLIGAVLLMRESRGADG